MQKGTGCPLCCFQNVCESSLMSKWMGTNPLSSYSWLPPALVVHWQCDKVGRVEGRTSLVCPSSPKVTCRDGEGLASNVVCTWYQPCIACFIESVIVSPLAVHLGHDLRLLSQVIRAPSWCVCCAAGSTWGRPVHVCAELERVVSP